MITCTRLGKFGRLGNQLFQVAFLTSFAKRHNIEYRLPPWRYAKYFDYDFDFSNDLSGLDYRVVTREPSLGYHEDCFVSLLPEIRAGNVDVKTGYFQSYKYFTKEHVLTIFKPRSSSSINLDRCVAIHVRRGDFVKSPYFNTIEAEIFLDIIGRSFGQFRVFVFSDDYAYCRARFRGPQFEFPEGLNDIEHLQLMARFEHFILSNSTFSYWGAMLSARPKAVFYPRNMFPCVPACHLYNQVYWPKDSVYMPYDNPTNKPPSVLPDLDPDYA